MKNILKKRLPILFASAFVLVAFLGTVLSSCSKDDVPEEVRSENDILGVWTDGEDNYMVLDTAFRAFELFIDRSGDEIMPRWSSDVYFYEPGYEILIYIDRTYQPDVYKIISLTPDELVWCWVENLRDKYSEGEPLGDIIGQVIQQAQAGYEVNPMFYHYFAKVPYDDFMRMLEEMGIGTPW